MQKQLQAICNSIELSNNVKQKQKNNLKNLFVIQTNSFTFLLKTVYYVLPSSSKILMAREINILREIQQLFMLNFNADQY